MTDADRLALLAERQRRQRRQGFTAASLLFDLQQRFVDDPARLIVICAARRAGKTHAEAFKLVRMALARPSVNVVYTALTLKQAKRNIWARLLELSESFDLGGVPNRTTSTITFPNGSVIHVSGMDEVAEADKWRGLPRLVLAILDESQSYREEVIDYAVNEVFRPGMLDLRDSQLILSGSPGPLPVGYFHGLIHAERTPWSRHGWDIFANPKLEGDPHQVIAEACLEKGITPDAPWIQRSFYNRWVQDLDALIYPYDPALNDFDPARDKLPADVLHTVGVDFGVRDSDAIVVWAVKGRTCWAVEQHCHRGQTTDQIVGQLKDVVARYQPVDVAGDPAAGGARIALDLAAIHGISMRAADKTDRIAAINLLADAVRSGRVKVPRESRLVQEWKRLEWEPGQRGVRERRGGPHFDLPDAALYGWRAASKYFSVDDPEPARRVLTPAQRWEQRLREDEEREAERDEAQRAGGAGWAERDWSGQGW